MPTTRNKSQVDYTAMLNPEIDATKPQASMVTIIHAMEVEVAAEDSETAEEHLEDVDSDEEAFPVTKFVDCISPEGVTYEIMENCSAKGSDKLFSSDGYSFGLKKSRPDGYQYWLCAKRSNKSSCPAKIIKFSDGTYNLTGANIHCHPPDPNKYVKAQLSTAIKQKALQHPTKSTRKMAKKLLEKYLPNGVEGRKITAEQLGLAASRYRRITLEKEKGGKPASAKKKMNKPVKTLSHNDIGTSFSKVRKRKHKRRLRMKKHKLKKKKSQHFKHTLPMIDAEHGEGTSYSPRKTSGFDSDDYIPLYVPKKYFKEILKEGFQHIGLTTIPSSGQNQTDLEETEAESNHKLVNGSLTSESAAAISTTSSGFSMNDPDDMFFCSLAADVKDLPKLQKSTLKLDILTLVNSVMQNLSGSGSASPQIG